MSSSPIHVTAGVIYDQRGRILITRRPAHLHQGGLWEFPGGKVQTGEYVIAALQRELHEELGILVRKSRPLIHIHHDYGDKRVWLDVHEVLEFTGKPHGCEGQPLRWITRDELINFTFPDANTPIVKTLQLPREYMITGEFTDTNDCLRKTRLALQRGIRMIQLRAKHLNESNYRQLANEMYDICERASAKLIVNTTPAMIDTLAAHGLHLTSSELLRNKQRPIAKSKWLFASVHNLQELEHAKRMEVDAMVIAPVNPTPTHPAAKPLEWDGLEQLARQANCPVYALGGVSPNDFAKVRAWGAQGVAGIRAFWV